MSAKEPRIAEIKPHPRRRQSYLLIVEGDEPLCVHEDVLVELALTKGRFLTDDLRRQIHRQSRLVEAQQILLRQLKARGRSRAELVGTLHKRGFDDALIDDALRKLEKLGLVDDEGFARALADSLLRRQGLGRQGLHYRLTQRGIDDEAANAAVADALEGADELQRAVDSLRLKLPRWEDLPPAQRRAKAYQFLARRGFEQDAIADALSTVLPDEQ